jgi:hypothetical protein
MVGRVALAAQGALYVIIGLLAIQVAAGDRSAEPSHRGALEAVVRQPLGKALLVVVIVGLVAHMIWRVALAVRGEPDDDEDASSVGKRLGHVGRALVYGGFTFAAVRLLTGSGSSASNTEEKGTAVVLGLPGGPALVVIGGLIVICTGLWNAYRGLSRHFEDKLTLVSLDEPKRKAVVGFGMAGYIARGVAFALVGVFLVRAGLTHDPDQTEGLDGALREVADAAYGPWLLGLLALGLILFGLFRALEGRYRKREELAYS